VGGLPETHGVYEGVSPRFTLQGVRVVAPTTGSSFDIDTSRNIQWMNAGFDAGAGFASNGYGEHSPGGYSLTAALITEIVMTFMFLIIILGATDSRAPQGFAPIAIGLGLTLIHLISIPVTNTSVNPARSTGVAIFQGDWAISQLWLFWIAPIVGAVLAGVVYRWLGEDSKA
jgi:aquaporin Z